MSESTDNLNSLNPGECGIITELKNKGNIRRRLMELGFAKGSKTACLGIAPCGDPKAFLIKNTVIALREEDSALIKIIKENSEK